MRLPISSHLNEEALSFIMKGNVLHVMEHLPTQQIGDVAISVTNVVQELLQST